MFGGGVYFGLTTCPSWSLAMSASNCTFHVLKWRMSLSSGYKPASRLIDLLKLYDVMLVDVVEDVVGVDGIGVGFAL